MRMALINMLDGKILTDLFGASLLLLEFSCFRNIVLPYHLRVPLRIYTRKCLLSETVSLVYCFQKEHIIKYKITGVAAHCFLFPKPVIGNLCVCVHNHLKANKIFR